MIKRIATLYENRFAAFLSLIVLSTLFRILIPFYREYIYPDSVLWIKYAIQIQNLDFGPVLGGILRYVESLFKYTPGYSFFIALWNIVLHDPVKSSLVASFVFGILNPWLVFLIAKKIVTKQVAYLAALIGCFHPIAIKMSCNSLINTTVSFFFLIAVYLILQYCEKPDKKYSLLLGFSLFAVYLCRFELGLLYLILIPLWCIVSFWRSARIKQVWNITICIGVFSILFLIHSLVMFRFTGMFFSEYLFLHNVPAMKVNEWLSRRVEFERIESKYPELEKDLALIDEWLMESDNRPITEKTLKFVEDIFENYEQILLIIYIFLWLRVKNFRLPLQYEGLVLYIFILSFLFFVSFVQVFQARYLYHLSYLFYPLYAHAIVSLCGKVREKRRGLFSLAMILLLLPLVYKGFSYNWKSIKGKSLQNSPYRQLGGWIKNHCGTGQILVLGDNRYGLFSGNYSYLFPINDPDELLRRARRVGASYLILDQGDVKIYPALEKLFQGERSSLVLIHQALITEDHEEIAVKVFRLIPGPGSSGTPEND